ncbi:MAG: helix-turn-helix transcriptional regulator [Clostridia bacterium]|nr:helix-turn-helix transcriptional regulator [Clostridia bacterium]
MSINDNFKTVRKHFGLTQEEFGDQLGVTRGVIYNIEKHLTEPKPYIINQVSLVYGIDPIWLETGAGEMFHKPSEDEEMAAFSAKMISDPDPFKRRFFYALSRMDESGWDKIKEFLEFLKEAEEKEKDGN